VAKLIIKEGDYTHEHALDEVETLIGRSQKCIVRLTEAAASRNHCTILKTPEGWLLMDLQSSNGTILNGIRITESLLKTGDVIRIGNAEMTFKDDLDDSKKLSDVREKLKELERDPNVARVDLVKGEDGSEELVYRKIERSQPPAKDPKEPETKDSVPRSPSSPPRPPMPDPDETSA
jgi:pSer/pThr/pTyr-binding forkhead associated (FHA) protein